MFHTQKPYLKYYHAYSSSRSLKEHVEGVCLKVVHAIFFFFSHTLPYATPYWTQSYNATCWKLADKTRMQTNTHRSTQTGSTLVHKPNLDSHTLNKKLNWPARALMRERSNRRAELFSLSHSVSAAMSQRLLMSLYCCWISTLSKSVGEMVLMVTAGNSTAALEIRRRKVRWRQTSFIRGLKHFYQGKVEDRTLITSATPFEQFFFSFIQVKCFKHTTQSNTIVTNTLETTPSNIAERRFKIVPVVEMLPQ